MGQNDAMPLKANLQADYGFSATLQKNRPKDEYPWACLKIKKMFIWVKRSQGKPRNKRPQGANTRTTLKPYLIPDLRQSGGKRDSSWCLASG